MFFINQVLDAVEVQPKFELVVNIVVLFVRGDYFAVFQVKIVVGLAAFTGAVGEVRRREKKTESASDDNDE